MGYIVESSAPNFQAVRVEELLEDVFNHLCLRITSPGLGHEFVYHTHTNVDDLFQEVLFQLFMQIEPSRNEEQ